MESSDIIALGTLLVAGVVGWLGWMHYKLERKKEERKINKDLINMRKSLIELRDTLYVKSFSSKEDIWGTPKKEFERCLTSSIDLADELEFHGIFLEIRHWKRFPGNIVGKMSSKNVKCSPRDLYEKVQKFIEGLDKLYEEL